MGIKTLGDYVETTTYDRLLATFPSIFGEYGRAYYDYKLNDDNIDYMPIYLHKMTGGTSFKN